MSSLHEMEGWSLRWCFANSKQHTKQIRPRSAREAARAKDNESSGSMCVWANVRGGVEATEAKKGC